MTLLECLTVGDDLSFALLTMVRYFLINISFICFGILNKIRETYVDIVMHIPSSFTLSVAWCLSRMIEPKWRIYSQQCLLLVVNLPAISDQVFEFSRIPVKWMTPMLFRAPSPLFVKINNKDQYFS